MYGGEVVDFARHGFVVATLDYRLLDPDAGNVARHPFPAALDDLRCGVRFLRAHARRFALDPARIGATGHSAGGHLSLLAGLADAPARDGEEWPSESGRVQAVVNQSGPTDLEALWGSPSDVRRILTMLLPGPAESLARRFAAASPVTFASADDPPVLTLHGELDPQVPVEQARLLDRALRAVHARHELVVLPGEGHGFSAKAYGANQERIRAFFARELAPRPGAAAD